jgi:hypothetical protein
MDDVPEAQGFLLVHAGKLNTTAGKRPSNGLLKALRRLVETHPKARSSTTLRLVVPRDRETETLAAELDVEQLVESTDRVSYEESLRHIASARVTVLIEADVREGIYFPSKLADYLAARKPVLALSPRVGTAADMPADSGVVRVDVNDDDTIYKVLQELYEDFAQGALDGRRPSGGFSEQFTPQSVARTFVESLENTHVRTTACQAHLQSAK